jgi:hypothetical protein
MSDSSNNRFLIGVAIAVALLAGVGAGAAIVTSLSGSSTDKTVKTIAAQPVTTSSGSSAGKKQPTVRKTIVVQGSGSASATPATTIPVAFTSYSPSNPDYFYLAQLPSGGGWSVPAENFPTQGKLLRTETRGPDGTFVIVDRTPDEVPQLGGGYDDVRTVSQPFFGSATEYIFSQSQSIPECNGRPCVDFLIDDGQGGGWGVLAGGPSIDAAQGIGSQVAQSVSYGD